MQRGRGKRLLDVGPLAALIGFSVVAVAGYAIFGRDPTRVAGLSPGAARFYAVSFGFFAQVQIALAGVVLAVHLLRRAGWRWLGAFVAVYVLSLGSELLGTAFGVPFGPYAYTDLLGAKWLDLVPALIPLSWFFMAVPAYGLAARALDSEDAAATGGPTGAVRSAGSSAGSSAGRVGSGRVAGLAGPVGAGRVGGLAGSGWGGRIVLGSLLLLAWDLSLDPAMSEATRYWVWAESGPYYGMPLMNLVGWYVTGVVLMAALEWLGARRWLSGVSAGWLALFYAANLVLPLGMAAAAGLWGAVVATVVVLGGVALWARLRSRPGGARLVPAPVEASSGAEVGR
ncbi:MAG: carotenoid biosynthesis protein, partial [Gemmatimonadota bacterium]